MLKERNLRELVSDSDEDEVDESKLSKKAQQRKKNLELAKEWNPEARKDKFVLEKEKKMKQIQSAIYSKVK